MISVLQNYYYDYLLYLYTKNTVLKAFIVNNVKIIQNSVFHFNQCLNRFSYDIRYKTKFP